MEPQTVNAWSDTLTKLLANTSGSAFLFGILAGWGVMMAVMYPIKQKVKDDGLATWYLRTICVVASFLWALLLWPKGPWNIIIGLSSATGLLSPVFWFLLTHVIGWFSPTLATALKLKRISLDTENENDVRPPEPRPDTP